MYCRFFYACLVQRTHLCAVGRDMKLIDSQAVKRSNHIPGHLCIIHVRDEVHISG